MISVSLRGSTQSTAHSTHGAITPFLWALERTRMQKGRGKPHHLEGLVPEGVFSNVNPRFSIKLLQRRQYAAEDLSPALSIHVSDEPRVALPSLGKI